MADEEEIVHVVDDDVDARKSLARLLRSAGYAVETFAGAAELLAQDLNQRAGCILLDVSMPGLGGMELQAELNAQGVDLPVVFLTGHGDIPMSVRAMKEGAVDFLTKVAEEEVLLAAVQQALLLHRSRRAERREIAAIRARTESLTSREQEVLRYVIAGARNKQIAYVLGISEQTVKIHRRRVMAKLGVNTVTALIQVCQRAGIEPQTGLKYSRDSG